jgi:hypothetical protein
MHHSIKIYRTGQNRDIDEKKKSVILKHCDTAIEIVHSVILFHDGSLQIMPRMRMLHSLEKR